MGTRKGIQLFGLISLLVALAGCASHKNSGRVSVAAQSGLAGTKWGYYNGDPVTKWNPDGRTMTLLTELRYTDPHGRRWRIHPALSLVDHGRAVRRKISEWLCVARRRVRGTQPAIVGL